MGYFKITEKELMGALENEFEDGDQIRDEICQDVQDDLRVFEGEIRGMSEEDEEKEGGSAYKVKDVKRTVAWLTANVVEAFTSGNDIVRVEARKAEDLESAKKASELINYQLNKRTDFFDLLRRIVKTTARERYSVVRAYWDYETIERVIKKVKNVHEDELETAIASEMEKMEEDDENGIKIDDIEVLDIEEKEEGFMDVKLGYYEVVEESPSFELVNKEKFIYDPNGITLKFGETDCNFVIQKHTYTYSELKEEELFDQDMVKELIEDKVLENYDEETDIDRKKPETAESVIPNEEFGRGEVSIIEHFSKIDINDDGITENIRVFYEESTQKVLCKQRNPYPNEVFPFLLIPYDTDSGTMYKESVVTEIEDLQTNRTASLRLVFNNLAYMVNKFLLFEKGAVDPENQERILDRQLGGYAEVNDLEKFQEIDSGSFPGEILSLFDLLGSESFKDTGISSQPQGMIAKSNRTSSGISQVSNMANQRLWEKVKTFEQNLILPLAKMYLKLNQANLEDAEFKSSLTGEFVTISKEDIKPNFDISIKANSAAASQEKAQYLMQLMNLLQAPIKMKQLPPKLITSVVKRLVELWRLPGMNEEILQAEQEMQQMKQQQEQKEQGEMSREERKMRQEQERMEMEKREKSQDREQQSFENERDREAQMNETLLNAMSQGGDSNEE